MTLDPYSGSQEVYAIMSVPPSGANTPQFGSEAAPTMEALQAFVNERLIAMGTEIERSLNERQTHLAEDVRRGVMGAMGSDSGRAKTGFKPPKPPFFEGARKGQFTRWAFQVRQYMKLVGMSDEAYCVNYAASLFRGPASTWWQNVIERYGEDTIDKWQDFVQLAEEQFGARDDHQRARDELARIRQERSVEEYVSQFMEIKTRVKGITNDEALDRFKRGLKVQIRLDVERADPRDLQAAMTHALRADDILSRTMHGMRNNPMNRGANSPRRQVPYADRSMGRNGNGHYTRLEGRSIPQRGPAPMEIDNVTGNSRGQPDKQRCRRCTGIGHWEKDCPTHANHPALNRHHGPRRSITNVEITEEDDTCVDMDYPYDDQQGGYCGLIHRGGDRPHPLPSYHGQLGGRTCHFLVDSGATDNFVSPHFLREGREKWPGEEQQKDVIMTNGSRQATGRTYEGVQMQIGAQSTHINVTEMPMVHFDAILGGPWLAKERPRIRWESNVMEWKGEVMAPAHGPTDESRQEATKFNPVEDALQRWGNAEWVFEGKDGEDDCDDVNIAVVQLQKRERTAEARGARDGHESERLKDTKEDSEAGFSDRESFSLRSQMSREATTSGRKLEGHEQSQRTKREWAPTGRKSKIGTCSVEELLPDKGGGSKKDKRD